MTVIKVQLKGLTRSARIKRLFTSFESNEVFQKVLTNSVQFRARESWHFSEKKLRNWEFISSPCPCHRRIILVSSNDFQFSTSEQVLRTTISYHKEKIKNEFIFSISDFCFLKSSPQNFDICCRYRSSRKKALKVWTFHDNFKLLKMEIWSLRVIMWLGIQLKSMHSDQAFSFLCVYQSQKFNVKEALAWNTVVNRE